MNYAFEDIFESVLAQIKNNVYLCSMITTRKIELFIDRTGKSDEDCDKLWAFLFNINDNLFRYANRLINRLYLQDEIGHILRLHNEDYIKLHKAVQRKGLSEDERKKMTDELTVLIKETDKQGKEFLKRPIGSFAYSAITDPNEAEITGQILSALKQAVHTEFLRQSPDVQKGNSTISCYRKGMPIPFNFNPHIRIDWDKEADVYTLKWFGGIYFDLFFGKDINRNKALLARCLSANEEDKDYKLCGSSIRLINENGKVHIYLNLCIDAPKVPYKPRAGRVVGVVLGTDYPLVAASNETSKIQKIGDTSFIQTQLVAFGKRFRSVQKLRNVHGGHGSTKKMEALTKVIAAHKKWIKQVNHLLSKDVIEYATHINAEQIIVQSMTNSRKTTSTNDDVATPQYILRGWDFSQLKQYLEYKANRYGIKITFVDEPKENFTLPDTDRAKLMTKLKA